MKYLLVLVAVPLLAAAGVGTVADRAFELLRQTPPVSPDVFDFAIVADTRSLKVDQQSETFKQLIRDFNILRPSFVVDVGDIILGGSADLVLAQWDEFDRVTAELQVPLFPVTGNHDIFDEPTEKIWEERVGPTCYAFSYGNSRFVAMNSEENGVVDTVSDSQVAWLKKDLESNPAKHIFVFIHQPFFTRDWDKQWAKVHAVLKQHPVRIVFGGDNHLYRYFGERDGIHYVISAGGGAEVRVPEDEGGFHHFVLVKVRGDKVDWSVVKPGSFLPHDVVTQARVDEVRNARTNWIKSDTVVLPVGETFDRSVAVTIQNPTATSYDGTLTWTVPAGWHVEPVSIPYSAHAQAGSSEPASMLNFSVRADGPAAVKYPVPEFKTVFAATQHGAPVEVTGRLNLIPAYTIHRAASAPTIDGDLIEWMSVPQIPLPYGWNFDIADTADHASTIAMTWDSENLYFAATVKDDEFNQPYAGDIVWSADGLQMFLRMDDPNAAPENFRHYWEWGLTLTKTGPEVFMYHGVDRESIVVNTAVQLAVKRAGDMTYYEARFPKSEVHPLQLAAGSRCKFSIAANDLDPSKPDRPRHWAELTPGVGDAVPGSPMALITLAE